jgi:hypothetical protein
MKPFLQLNLNSNSETTEEVKLPRPEREEPESEEARKRLTQLANRVAHRAAASSSRHGSGIFSK